MKSVPFSLYDAFSDTVFGGSQAGIVSNAADFDQKLRQQIALEIGAPATCFITAQSADSISVRFHSTKTEYSMCGHGTVCLMTQMVELGSVNFDADNRTNIKLCLPSSNTQVEIIRQDHGRPRVMLDFNPPEFRLDDLNLNTLAELLDVEPTDFDLQWPLETAVGDFVHLLIPMKHLEAIRRIQPDFQGLSTFCHKHSIQTVAVFCKDVEQTGYHLHVRDFCPAVGVPESAAAGTTNAALTCYLIRHGIVHNSKIGDPIIVMAEQGREMERSSSIRSVVTMDGDVITRLQVGGVATKVMDGQLYLPVMDK